MTEGISIMGAKEIDTAIAAHADNLRLLRDRIQSLTGSDYDRALKTASNLQMQLAELRDLRRA